MKPHQNVNFTVASFFYIQWQIMDLSKFFCTSLNAYNSLS